MKSAIRQYMIGVSSYSNHLIASKLPGLCPFILVCEFPRSGGTWIRDMLGDTLQLPVTRYSLLPVTCHELVHSQFNSSVNRSLLVSVVNDVRDGCLSHFPTAVTTVLTGM